MIRRREFISKRTKDALPSVYPNRSFVAGGGLASYGPDPIAGVIPEHSPCCPLAISLSLPPSMALMRPGDFAFAP